MTRRELAAALRVAANLLDEPEPGPSHRRRGKRPAFVPPGPIDEVTAARAKAALNKAGVR